MQSLPNFSRGRQELFETERLIVRLDSNKLRRDTSIAAYGAGCCSR